MALNGEVESHLTVKWTIWRWGREAISTNTWSWQTEHVCSPPFRPTQGPNTGKGHWRHNLVCPVLRYKAEYQLNIMIPDTKWWMASPFQSTLTETSCSERRGTTVTWCAPALNPTDSPEGNNDKGYQKPLDQGAQEWVHSSWILQKCHQQIQPMVSLYRIPAWTESRKIPLDLPQLLVDHLLKNLHYKICGQDNNCSNPSNQRITSF